MSSFARFEPEALIFLRGLRRNNRKEWFEERRPVYERALLAPLRSLSEELDVRFGRLAPEFVSPPKRALFRIHRDVRFSKDKSPYKAHGALWVYHRDAGRGVGRDAHGGAGFYFHIEPGASLVAAGFWMPPRPVLNIIHEQIVEDQRGFEKLLKATAFRRRFGGLSEDDPGALLTRMPRGYSEEHPAARWLRFNTFTASRALSDADVLSPRLVDDIMKDFATLLPLVRWLNRSLGYPAASRR